MGPHHSVCKWIFSLQVATKRVFQMQKRFMNRKKEGTQCQIREIYIFPLDIYGDIYISLCHLVIPLPLFLDCNNEKVRHEMWRYFFFFGNEASFIERCNCPKLENYPCRNDTINHKHRAKRREWMKEHILHINAEEI